MHARVVRQCLSLGVLMLLAGCATARHQEALYEKAHRHVYAQPIEQVWPQVVALVATEGYPPRKGEQEFILVTEWRQDTQESRVVSSASRIYAEGLRIDRNTSRVRIFRQTIFTGNKGAMSARDNGLANSLTVGAAGDIATFAEDPIALNHMLGTSADHTPLTRGPSQLNRSFSRDGQLEWKLLQRVNHEAANAIEASVTAQEQQ
ncbi:MAG: hypothetical protein JXB05_03685 [Myxococcaceae bacterium]|nr:hypothetical protein [Myxococcaceae bacterium]